MIDELNRDGIVLADQKLSGLQLFDIWDFLMPRPIYMGGHVMRYANMGSVTTEDYLKDAAAHAHHALGCYDFETAVFCPHLLEAALGYIDFAERYLGQEPILYSMNIWWSFAGGIVKPETQEFHRDPDDVKFVAMFFFITDTSMEGGHEFQAGTHNGSEISETVRIEDGSGTIFFADTRGFHRGMKPISSGRLAAWARFGVSDPPATYSGDGLAPVATFAYGKMSERERRVARLIVKPYSDGSNCHS